MRVVQDWLSILWSFVADDRCLANWSHELRLMGDRAPRLSAYAIVCTLVKNLQQLQLLHIEDRHYLKIQKIGATKP